MNTYTILLIEADPVVAMDLARRLTQMGHHVLSAVDSGSKALTIFQKHKVDLTLLDINVTDAGDGVEIATQIQQIRRSPFIFLTSSSDTSVLERARLVGPAAYIAKPFTDVTLRMAIDLAVPYSPSQPVDQRSQLLAEPTPEALIESGETLMYQNDIVFIKQNYKFVKFYLSEVLYIQSEGNYTDIITASKKYTIRLVLNKVLEKLQTADIVRNHRSYAVNIRHIHSFSEHAVHIGPHTIPVGRSYRETFVKRFSVL